MKLTKWTARRSGGFITVTGKDAEGHDRKIVEVTSIAPASSGFGAAATTGIVAVDRDGNRHQLEA